MTVSTPRGCLVFAALLACGPQTGAGSEAGATGSTGAPTTGAAASTTGDATTAAPTTGGPTTGSTTSDDTTADPTSECFWALEDGAFCPLLAAPNVAISGTTPFGPVSFGYAYFGVFRCGTCAYPVGPSLGLFSEPQQPGLEPFVGDHLVFKEADEGSQGQPEGEIAGVPVGFTEGATVYFSGVVPLTEAQMKLPLDPAAPPTVSGEFTFTGSGWDLSGVYTAGLCTTLDRIANCD